MMKKWTLLNTGEAEMASLAAETKIPLILLRIMWNRGLRDPVSIERYFEPRSRSLASPFLLEGICPAVDRIYKAIERDESIRIYGDRDVDGITSTVLLLETLKVLWKKVDFTIPVIEDGYGLNREYLDVAKRDGVSLIVTVDCGISNVDEIEYARDLGIDVIVTDHHEPPQNLPKAVAIIDPKLSGSYFPQKDMAGVGVSLKLSMALELVNSKALTHPIIAFDCESDEIDAVKFSPRGGFTPINKINSQCLIGATPLFFTRKEKEALEIFFPEFKQLYVDGRCYPAIFLSELTQVCTPDASGMTKKEIASEMSISPDFSSAKRLVIIYLKYLEAMEPQIKSLWQRALDVLTIGTIADMVPMKGENRTIAQMGLKFITRTKRLGMLELFSLLGWHQKSITEKEVSFNIAPILNSSGRLKSAELAIDLLTTESPARAKSLAKELFELNIERKRLAEECYRQVKEFMRAQNNVDKAKILIVNAPIHNQGVTGIVATRLMLDFCRPVVVLLEDHGRYLGSARSYKNINMISALHSCSGILSKYGGHIGAAGLTLGFEKIEAFRKCLTDYAQKNISDEDLQAEWLIDQAINIDMVDDTFLADLTKFSPFGIENPPPLFAGRNFQYYEIRKVGEGKNHLRFKFRKSTGQALFGIGFNLGKLLSSDCVVDGICDLVFTVEANDYNGTRVPQIVVCDILFPANSL